MRQAVFAFFRFGIKNINYETQLTKNKKGRKTQLLQVWMCEVVTPVAASKLWEKLQVSNKMQTMRRYWFKQFEKNTQILIENNFNNIAQCVVAISSK